jgi:hypothetical protein
MFRGLLYLCVLGGLASCSSGAPDQRTEGGAAGNIASGGNGSSAGTPGKVGDTAGNETGGDANASAGSGGGGSAEGGRGGQGSGAPGSGPIDCRAKGDGKSTVTLINHCQGSLSYRGSGLTGGELAPGEHACEHVGNTVESIPAIRFWGFIGPDPGGERYTLAELTLNTDFNDFDWYNISHVDAHNLPMQVSAVAMPSCRTLTCGKSLLEGCPAEGQLEDQAGKLISCFSPQRDDRNSQVAKYFEAGCADAYSWSGDDQDSVVATRSSPARVKTTTSFSARSGRHVRTPTAAT